jgi:hypothetical protein
VGLARNGRVALAVLTAAALGAAMSATASTAGASTQSRSQHQISTVIRPYSTVRIVTSVTRGGITRGSLTVIARFRLPDTPPGYQAANVNADDSIRNCADDSGYTYQGCLTQYYISCSVGTEEYVNVTQYTESWTMIDPSGEYQLKTPAGLRAGVFGGANKIHCGGKSGIFGQTQTKIIHRPSPSTKYNLDPKWSGAYIGISSMTFQCANAYVQIYWSIHPARHWTFEQPDVCQGELDPELFKTG